jgi:putative membrane protein
MSLLATTAATVTLADNDGHEWWPLIPLFWFAAFIVFFFIAARIGWWGRRRGCFGDRYYRDGSHTGKTRLADRFAAGEIDEQEYRSRLAVLEESSARSGRR